jgi:hypothetical protein
MMPAARAGLFTLLALWGAVFCAVLALMVRAAVAQRCQQREWKRRLPADVAHYDPDAVTCGVVIISPQGVRADFERDIAALRELEHVPDEWIQR